MKEKYIKPESEVIIFECEDVITTSDNVIELPFIKAGSEE